MDKVVRENEKASSKVMEPKAGRSDDDEAKSKKYKMFGTSLPLAYALADGLYSDSDEDEFSKEFEECDIMLSEAVGNRQGKDKTEHLPSPPNIEELCPFSEHPEHTPRLKAPRRSKPRWTNTKADRESSLSPSPSLLTKDQDFKEVSNTALNPREGKQAQSKVNHLQRNKRTHAQVRLDRLRRKERTRQANETMLEARESLSSPSSPSLKALKRARESEKEAVHMGNPWASGYAGKQHVEEDKGECCSPAPYLVSKISQRASTEEPKNLPRPDSNPFWSQKSSSNKEAKSYRSASQSLLTSELQKSLSLPGDSLVTSMKRKCKRKHSSTSVSYACSVPAAPIFPSLPVSSIIPADCGSDRMLSLSVAPWDLPVSSATPADSAAVDIIVLSDSESADSDLASPDDKCRPISDVKHQSDKAGTSSMTGRNPMMLREMCEMAFFRTQPKGQNLDLSQHGTVATNTCEPDVIIKKGYKDHIAKYIADTTCTLELPRSDIRVIIPAGINGLFTGYIELDPTPYLQSIPENECLIAPIPAFTFNENWKIPSPHRKNLPKFQIKLKHTVNEKEDLTGNPCIPHVTLMAGPGSSRFPPKNHCKMQGTSPWNSRAYLSFYLTYGGV